MHENYAGAQNLDQDMCTTTNEKEKSRNHLRQFFKIFFGNMG